LPASIYIQNIVVLVFFHKVDQLFIGVLLNTVNSSGITHQQQRMLLPLYNAMKSKQDRIH
jgi:hypothetical protein